MSVVKRNLFLLAAAASRCPTMLKSVFRIKSLFFCSLIFLCLFLKNKRTRRIKIASSLLRFLTRKRTGYGAEPRKRGSGLCPGKKLFCQFAALFKALLYCLYAGGTETVFFQCGNARNGCSAGRANVIF